MTQKEIIPLDKKINGYDPITQLVVRNDVKENIHGFLKELKNEVRYHEKTINKLAKEYFGGLAE
jgi:hypothetical protein